MLPTGSVVDVRSNTSNIDYVKEISSLNFNGTNYFDLKLSPNITKGLIEPFHLEKTKTPNLKYGPLIYEKSYNYGFMDGFIFAQKDNKIKPNETKKSYNNTIVMGYTRITKVKLVDILVSSFRLCSSRQFF